MSACDAIRGSAVALLALPASDPERARAAAHASSCAGCAAALREASLVVEGLDRAPAPAPPAAEVLARVRAEVLLRLDRETAPEPGWRRALVPAQIAALFLVEVLRSRTGFPAALWVQALLLGLAAAVLASLARSRGRLATGLALAVAALAGVVLGGPGELHANHGVSCALIELVVAGIPLATSAVLLAGREIRPAMLPAVAAAGALGGQASLVLLCPYRTWGHLLVFHLGAVLLAAALGAALQAALRARQRSRT